MRGFFVAVWLLVPVLAGAYHYGPGQARMELDKTQAALDAARTARDAGRHGEAVKQFTKALETLPETRADEAQTIRVERAKSMLLDGQLPQAYDELATLLPTLTDPEEGASVDTRLLSEAREAFASARYYLTWLLRLEGAPRAEWEPEIEGSRQLYRLLAEDAKASGRTSDYDRHRDDIESAIRLARLDLSDLQALALPSQCKGCCSGECKCKGKGQKPGKGKGRGPQKKQGDESARGASSGPPPDGSGN
ncbi:MAG: hypothetical protein R3B90_05340 [Planctomycetaceae bacterium]